ncbi:MAG: TlpA disulfide reductase family protein [Gordonia sp. (in: high G+C Gram-positive bacteria)]
MNTSSSPRRTRFPAAARATAAFAVVMIALIVALWPRGSDDSSTSPSLQPPAAASAPPAASVDEAQLAQARAAAAIDACPQPSATVTATSVLRGVSAPCLASGLPYDLGAGTAGKPVLVNMWAVWCLPCRRELPVLADFARRAAGKVSVLAVHDQQGASSPFTVLQFLHALGVYLPGVLDVDGKVAAALRAPRVYPSTILLRADGSVAKVLPGEFADTDQIAAAVRKYLGVMI